MKIQKNLLSLTIVALAIWTPGCKEEAKSVNDQAQDAARKTGDVLQQTADTVKETGEKLVTDVKDASQKVAQDVADKAKELSAPASAKAQELLDSAKRLIGEGKLQEALARLKDLTGEKLSAEQQALADSLKAQVDKLLGTSSKTATDAAAAAGNLLNK